MDTSRIQSYCHVANYCYACFLIDPQDPEILCNGLCYECHAARWEQIKGSFTLDIIANTLSKINTGSNWYSLYYDEYKIRLIT